jgi:putative transposase
MRGPQPPAVTLAADERQALEALARRPSTPQQQALRARLVLAAAAGLNNAQIARQYAVSLEMVRLWRDRWRALQAVALADLPLEDRLSDAPRAGRPPTITAAQTCQIVALACAAPATTERPISQWSGRELAAEIIKQGILDRISPRHAARLLKRGTSNRTASAIG